MFKVVELFFVDAASGWAVALEPQYRSDPAPPVGSVLVQGARRWTVTGDSTAPAGLVAVQLDGPAITRGLILRALDEPMQAAEFAATATLLANLMNAFQSVDCVGMVRYLEAQPNLGNAAAITALTRIAVYALARSPSPEELAAVLATFRK